MSEKDHKYRFEIEITCANEITDDKLDQMRYSMAGDVMDMRNAFGSRFTGVQVKEIKKDE